MNDHNKQSRCYLKHMLLAQINSPLLAIRLVFESDTTQETGRDGHAPQEWRPSHRLPDLVEQDEQDRPLLSYSDREREPKMHSTLTRQHHLEAESHVNPKTGERTKPKRHPHLEVDGDAVKLLVHNPHRHQQFIGCQSNTIDLEWRYTIRSMYL